MKQESISQITFISELKNFYFTRTVVQRKCVTASATYKTGGLGLTRTITRAQIQ